MINLKTYQICSDYSAVAHIGQTRKGNNIKTPYVVHELRVSSYVMASKIANTTTVCAAVMHDVIEDCSINEERTIIKNHYYDDNNFENFLTENSRIHPEIGKKIFIYVNLLTHSNILSKEEKKIDSYTRIRDCRIPEVAVIKFCDRIDNLISIPWSFSYSGQKYYIKDTEMMIDYIGDIVANTDKNIYELLIKTLKETKKDCGM
jgi:GTP pyrophosphokinase